MLDAMRNLVLLELNRRFGSYAVELTQLRRDHGPDIASLLVEPGEKIPRVYLLRADPQRDRVVQMWPEELTDEKRRKLPFNRPSGSQSGSIGPVLKRSFKPNKDPSYGPSLKILETSRTDFLRLANENTKWALYFQEVNEVLFQDATLEYGGETHETGVQKKFSHPLEAAVRLIPDKETVFLSVVDSQGRWPGEREEYQEYLANTLAVIKYTTGAASPRLEATCPLCGVAHVTVYPNALKGAGINFFNMDREGAFPSLSTDHAWKGYALCLDCADLLYIFKFHLLDKFVGRVAGKKALLLPSLLGNKTGQQLFVKDWADYIQGLVGHNVKDLEEDLMEFFAGQDDAHLVLNILWASFGQVIDDCRGYVTDILPSRLQRLIEHNTQTRNWSQPFAPRQAIPEANPDVSLSFLYPMFHRPGGKPAKGANNSTQLFAVKQDLATALYHGTPLRNPNTLWRELLITAQWYFRDIAKKGNDWGLTHEGVNKKNETYWTLAGWVRHLARFLHYLDQTGVLPMPASTIEFEPRIEALRPYFSQSSGIDRQEKAFAFLLGILYGKLLQVQGARGVNVSSNALTWLKRLKLSGRDLPELYIKIREKLLNYETESSPRVRELVHEIGRLGALLGDHIELDNTATCYFLLLGQSVTVDILPSKEGDA